MICEVFTDSTSITPIKRLIYTFTKTAKLGIDFQAGFINPNYDWMTFPITDSCSDFFEAHTESDSYKMMLATEKVLGRDWDSPEEDEAWADL